MTTCWICSQNPADSSEHIFKARDLSRIFDKDGYQFENTPFHFGPKGARRLPGPNAQRAKYPKLICADCNNKHTATADYAYDKLSDWFIASQSRNDLFEMDLESVFGADWPEALEQFRRYCAKSLGCRILNAGHSLPPDFPNPLTGQNLDRLQLSICRVEPFRSFENYESHLFETNLGKGDLGGWSSNVGEAGVSKPLFSRAVWWESIGHFQVSHWFNYEPMPAFGPPIGSRLKRYPIHHSSLDLDGIKDAFTQWMDQNSPNKPCVDQFLSPLILTIGQAYLNRCANNAPSISAIALELSSELGRSLEETFTEVDAELRYYRVNADLGRAACKVRRAAEFIGIALGLLCGEADTLELHGNAADAGTLRAAFAACDLASIVAPLSAALSQLVRPDRDPHEVETRFLEAATQIYDELGFVFRNDPDHCHVEIPFRAHNTPRL